MGQIIADIVLLIFAGIRSPSAQTRALAMVAVAVACLALLSVASKSSPARSFLI